MTRLRVSCLLAAACLMKFAPAAHAVERCPKPVVAALSQAAGIAPAKEEMPVIAQACKAWPHDPAVLLAALAYGKREDDRRTLVVAMVDAGTQRAISTYVLPLRENAGLRFLPYSLNIDTARYQLAPDLRAFSVRLAPSSNASCPDALRRRTDAVRAGRACAAPGIAAACDVAFGSEGRVFWRRQRATTGLR